ncbi:MAG: glycosyltransferase family 4 protein [Blastocatellia bacterium]|nr:glycosyltransferase family 4 protein [Blastocatellia bacterium]
MRIVHITLHGEIVGGTETYAADLHRLLEREGHEITLLHGLAVTQRLRAITSARVHVPALRPNTGPWPQRAAELRRIVERLDPDVILAHDVEEAAVLRLFDRLRPTIPFIHVHSRYVCPGHGKFYARQQRVCQRPFSPYCLIAPYLHGCATRRPWRLWANVRVTKQWIEAARQLPRLLVASQYMKRELMAVGLPEDRIVTNPIFVQPALVGEERPLPESEFPPTPLPIVLFCGRLYAHKGADLFLRALEFVAPSIHAVLIGEGPEQPRLERLAARVPTRHTVSFLGWLDRPFIFHLYRCAHAVVVPSVWPEPFCRVSAEALWHGAPVIAFRVGALPEWVRDGETGLLVEPGDIRALAAAIECLVTQGELMIALRSRAREFAEVMFASWRHLECLMRAFEDTRREWASARS